MEDILYKKFQCKNCYIVTILDIKSNCFNTNFCEICINYKSCIECNISINDRIITSFCSGKYICEKCIPLYLHCSHCDNIERKQKLTKIDRKYYCDICVINMRYKKVKKGELNLLNDILFKYCQEMPDHTYKKIVDELKVIYDKRT